MGPLSTEVVKNLKHCITCIQILDCCRTSVTMLCWHRFCAILSRKWRKSYINKRSAGIVSVLSYHGNGEREKGYINKRSAGIVSVLSCHGNGKEKNALSKEKTIDCRHICRHAPKFLTCCVSSHGRCYAWRWLTELSDAVLSCFTLCRSTVFTEASPIKPEDWPKPLFKTIVFTQCHGL